MSTMFDAENVIVAKNGDGGVTVTCPHCGGTDIMERDITTRYNLGKFSLTNDGLVATWTIGDAESDLDGYVCADCLEDVFVPLVGQRWRHEARGWRRHGS